MQGTALLADHQSIFPLTLTSLSNPLLYFSILCPPDTPSHCNIKFNDCHGVCFFLPHIPLTLKSCLKSSWWDSNHTDNKKGESYKAILFIKGETINYFGKYKDFFLFTKEKTKHNGTFSFIHFCTTSSAHLKSPNFLSLSPYTIKEILAIIVNIAK